MYHRANLHIIGHALILAMFYLNAGFIKSVSSKSTKLLNIHGNDIGAKHYSDKIDLDAIFAGRT